MITINYGFSEKNIYEKKKKLIQKDVESVVVWTNYTSHKKPCSEIQTQNLSAVRQMCSPVGSQCYSHYPNERELR